MPDDETLPVRSSNDIVVVRQVVRMRAVEIGFNLVEQTKIVTAASELARNTIEHGGGGQILLQAICRGDVRGIEIVGLDRGKGIADLGRSLRDGYSTAGSPGTGLGAIRRMAAAFDICSVPGLGTAVVATLWAGTPSPARGPRVIVGAASAAHAGESVSGDAWAMEQGAARTMLLVVDGLGHGIVAAEASREAVRLFSDNARHAPGVVVQALHDGMRATRGGAVAVTEIDSDRGAVRFAGLGNIGATIVSPAGRRHLVSHNGTAGHSVRRIDEFAYPWPKDSVLIQHTDGLSTHWDV